MTSNLIQEIYYIIKWRLQNQNEKWSKLFTPLIRTSPNILPWNFFSYLLCENGCFIFRSFIYLMANESFFNSFKSNNSCTRISPDSPHLATKPHKAVDGNPVPQQSVALRRSPLVVACGCPQARGRLDRTGARRGPVQGHNIPFFSFLFLFSSRFFFSLHFLTFHCKFISLPVRVDRRLKFAKEA